MADKLLTCILAGTNMLLVLYTSIIQLMRVLSDESYFFLLASRYENPPPPRNTMTAAGNP